MNNILNYYYNLFPEKTIFKNEKYFFTYNNNTYFIMEIDSNIDNLLNIINELNKTNIQYHLLVMNKFGKEFITIDNKKFVLLKVRENILEDINNKNQNNEFLTFNGSIEPQNECNWGQLWMQRIDYYEKQSNEIIKDNTIQYSMQYYLGLTENAIAIFDYLKKEFSPKDKIYFFQHYRYTIPNNYIDFYNPLNIIIDLNIRDFAEYIKQAFFGDFLTTEQIIKYIKITDFTDCMANYFLLRLIYPTYFFEKYDNYIKNQIVSNDIINIIKKSNDYRSLLNQIFLLINNKNKIVFHHWMFINQH